MKRGNLEGSRRKKTGVLFITYNQYIRWIGPWVGNHEVKTYQIPIPFLSKELESKSTRITSSICRALFAADSRETNKNRRLLTDFTEMVGNSQIRNIVRDLKDTMSACTLCMDDTKS